MEKQIDLESILEVIEPDLPKFEQLAEKEFSSKAVKSELEKLSKEELVELQVNMFSQYHQMAKYIAEMAEVLRLSLKSRRQR